MIKKYRAEFILKPFRIQRNLNQTELAQKIGVTPNTISKYETGEINPLMEKWIELANELDIHPEKFWKITELILE